MRFTRRLHRSEEGAAVAMALMVGAILVGFTTVVASAGMGQTRAVGYDENWELAFHAAEAAGELGLREVTAVPTFNTGHFKSTLTTTAAIIAAADARPVGNLHPVPGAQFVVVKPSDDTVVYGVGYSPTRAAVGRRVRVIAIQYNPGVQGWPMPGAAIIANRGGVTLSGNAYTTSNPTSAHAAGIIANSDVDLSGSTEVDGSVATTGTVDEPSHVYGSVNEGVAPLVFPTDAEVEAWRASLIAIARSTGRLFSGNKSFSNTTITAPMYVTGDLTLSNTVTITGSGVIYATGKITLPGGALVTAPSVTLASGGLMVFSGGSEYRLTSPSPAGGLVSFAANTKAITLSGGSEGTVQGVAFAPYGGISLSGSAAFHGSLIGRGGATGTLGKVELSGAASVEFPVGLQSSGFFNGMGSTSTATVAFRSER